MKVKIIEKGVNGDGNKKIPVGTIIEIEGKIIPPSLLNKCIVIGVDGPLIVNPAKQQTPIELTNDDAERNFLADYAKSLGVTVNDAWTLDELKAEIAKVESAAVNQQSA